jgi:hypothetical protein
MLVDREGASLSDALKDRQRSNTSNFMAEDKVRIESLQPGLQAFEPSQPFCSMERTNWEFGKYLHSRLCTGSCPPRHGMGACFSARIWRE